MIWRSVAARGASARTVVAPYIATFRSLHARKVAVAAGLLSCVGLAALAQQPAGSMAAQAVGAVTSTDRGVVERTSRSADRAGASAGASAAGKSFAIRSRVQLEAEAKRAAAKAAAARAAAAKAKVAPVGWLNQRQMDNAQRIVNEGRRLGMPKQAWIAAVACAMQESRLLNLASRVLPESYNYAHEGSGSDHDSVGLFQQRPSSGWGSVKQIMTPAYAARQFYVALGQVSGWQRMQTTYAIQAVQISAYPDAYAKHVATATAVVNAIVK